MRKLLFAAFLPVSTLLTAVLSAQTHPTTFPVVVTVAGHGEISVLVADGSTRPCDASNNRILFRGRARAGDQIKLTSTTGSACVDHTYGAFRRSQWAGPSLWVAGGRTRFGSAPAPVEELAGTISTDVP